jgi:hypothetical protein
MKRRKDMCGGSGPRGVQKSPNKVERDIKRAIEMAWALDKE